MKEDYPSRATKEAAKIKELYGDLAEPDFNMIFRNSELISKKYGKTLEITLTVQRHDLGDGETGFEMGRAVKEDLSKQVFVDDFIAKSKESTQDDQQLINIQQQMKILGKEYSKSSAEMADIFLKVSGQMQVVR